MIMSLNSNNSSSYLFAFLKLPLSLLAIFSLAIVYRSHLAIKVCYSFFLLSVLSFNLGYTKTRQDQTYSADFQNLISQKSLSRYCKKYRANYPLNNCQNLKNTENTVVLSSELSTQLEAELIKYLLSKAYNVSILIDRKGFDLKQLSFIKDMHLHQLHLGGITQLTLADSEALKVFPYLPTLVLNSIKKLDQASLDHLAKAVKIKELKLGLTKLTTQDVNTLNQLRLRALHFEHITKLSVQDVQVLSTLKVDELYLSGLKTLSIDVANELLKFSGDAIYLNGLQKIDQNVLGVLANGSERRYPQSNLIISLHGLKKLPFKTYTNFCSQLSFDHQWTGTLTSLSVQDAQALLNLASKGKCDLNYVLSLPRVKNISLDVLKVLVQYPNDLYLGGLKKLKSNMLPIIISGRANSIHFEGLKSIDPKQLKILMNQYRGSLSFGGLKQLNIKQAQEIARSKNNYHTLDFSGITELSPQIAHELSKSISKFHLSLNGLKSLSEESAKELSGFKGPLSLEGLEKASFEVIKALTTDRLKDYFSQHYLYLKFNQLQIDQKTLLFLAKYYPNLESIVKREVLSEQSMTPQLAQFMLDHTQIQFPSLANLKTIDPKVAEILAQMGKYYTMDLRGVESLSIEVATALKDFPGSLILGVTSLHENVLAALAQTKVKSLQFTKLKNLPLSYTESLSSSSLQHLYLDSITSSLSPKHIQALSKLNGQLYFGFETLDEQTAQNLSFLDVKSLSLNKLKNISPKTAKRLAQSKSDHLHLNHLQTLSIDSAKALAEFEGYWLHLPKKLYTESKEVAAALSQCLCRIKE